MRPSPILTSLLAFCTAAVLLPAQQKQQKKDMLLLELEQPQLREAPKELPQAVTVETSRLIFLQSPPSSRGLLSEQTSTAVDAILRQAGGTSVVRLRAFVAGTGDTRRVRTIVTEKFTERQLPLPALTVVQAGNLPGQGVQIVLEATAVSRRVENPAGLALITVHEEPEGSYPIPAAPFLRRALQQWREAAAAARVEGRDVVRVSCFVSSLEDWAESRRLLAAEFPKAVQNLVQPQRAHAHGLAACEIIARLRAAPPEPVQVVAAGGRPRAAVLIAAPRVVLSGSQIGFGFREEDARLAFQRLDKALEQSGASLKNAAWVSLYALSGRIGKSAAEILAEWWPESASPLVSVIPCEDLPALDASLAADALAVLP